jgi:hypothetical protein
MRRLLSFGDAVLVQYLANHVSDFVLIVFLLGRILAKESTGNMFFRCLTVVFEEFNQHDRLIDMLHLHIGRDELLQLIKGHRSEDIDLAASLLVVGFICKRNRQQIVNLLLRVSSNLMLFLLLDQSHPSLYF